MMSAARPDSEASGSLGRADSICTALGGLVAIAAALGIGRFVYTPILPPMIEALRPQQVGSWPDRVGEFYGLSPRSVARGNAGPRRIATAMAARRACNKRDHHRRHGTDADVTGISWAASYWRDRECIRAAPLLHNCG